MEEHLPSTREEWRRPDARARASTPCHALQGPARRSAAAGDVATFVADAVDAYRAAFADADVASASSGSSLAECDSAAEAAGRAAMLASLVEAGFPVLAPLLPMARRLAPAFSEATDWSKVEPWLWILIAASCPAGWGTSASLEPDFSLAYPAGVSLVIDCLVRACADVGLPFLAAIDTRCFATTTNGMMDKLPRFDCVRDDSEHSGGRACIGLVLAIALGIDEPAAFRLAVCIVQAGDDKVVSNAAQDRFAERVPSCELHRIDGARHELLKERDELRDKFWGFFDGFVARIL